VDRGRARGTCHRPSRPRREPPRLRLRRARMRICFAPRTRPNVTNAPSGASPWAGSMPPHERRGEPRRIRAFHLGSPAHRDGPRLEVPGRVANVIPAIRRRPRRPMSRIETILLATDASRASHAAEEQAIELAARLGSRLIVVSACSGSPEVRSGGCRRRARRPDRGGHPRARCGRATLPGQRLRPRGSACRVPGHGGATDARPLQRVELAGQPVGRAGTPLLRVHPLRVQLVADESELLLRRRRRGSQ
jgi:hypothetical protein